MENAPLVPPVSSLDKLYSNEEEESKFQKHGKNIAYLLDTELKLISHQNATGTTRLQNYQIEAVIRTADYFKENGEGSLHGKYALISAPPGSGKSGMITLLPYVLRSRKVLIITSSRIISDQIAKAFGFPTLKESFFFKTGVMQTPKTLKITLEVPHVATSAVQVKHMCFHNLVIVNAQKFSGNSRTSLTSGSSSAIDEIAEILSEFDTIIVDEAHHFPAPTWVKIVDGCQAQKVVFLTATPFRGSSGGGILHMTSICKKLQEVYSIPRNILEGTTIRKLEFIEYKTDNITEGLEFYEELKRDIQDILDRHKRTESRLQIHQALVVVSRKAKTQELAQALGANATFIIPGKIGTENLKNFTEGKKQIGVVCGMLREGYDNPNVTLCVILQKCESRVMFEQFCGRCMRVHRDLTGSRVDQTIGTVLSYEHFNQRKMWEAREYIANENEGDDENDDAEEELIDIKIIG